MDGGVWVGGGVGGGGGGGGVVGLDVRGTSADFLEYYRSEFEW